MWVLFMWVLAMFDLPTRTRQARNHYCRFRRGLLNSGFQQLQQSVYARPCATEENAEAHVARVAKNLPPDGDVRILSITDRQFARMRVYHGTSSQPPETRPDQLQMF